MRRGDANISATRSIESLEPRRLLSVVIEQLAAAPQAYSALTAVAAPIDAHIDAAAVRAELIRFVDTWNGGQLGKSGTSGMGTYAATWDGLFRMNLDRQFNKISYYTNDQTIISQSRAIYINAEAFRSAAGTEQARFKAAVQKGADYLLSHAVDPMTYNGKPGGMWWGLQWDGVSPPTHTTQIFGTQPRHKDAYGQVQALFSLAHAYSITRDADHLNAAFAQLEVWNKQFADAAVGAGAFLPTANETYSQRVDTRNLDYMTHALEALLALSDATPTTDPRRAQLASQINAIGNFITTRLYRNAPGSSTMGYLPWYYDAQWNASSSAGQQYMTPGHNLEVAYLLSRAVERGFSSQWLAVADKLIAFALAHGYDNSAASPTHGAVLYEKLNFNGTPFNVTADNLIWWQTSEAARTLLHFASVRGRADLWDEFDASINFIRTRFIDPIYGGWFTSLNPTTLAPTTMNKGTVWTGGYHETMLYAEMLRLATPAPTPFTGTPIAIASTGASLIQAEDFDNGGEGVAFHDLDAANNGKVYRATGVDIQATTDSGGGYNIGWTRTGEWLVYSVDIASAGKYDLDFRVASPSSGGKFHLELDGVNLTGAMTVPVTGGWQTWQNIRKSAINLPAGKHTLRLVMDSAGASGGVANFNHIRIAPASTSQTVLKATAAAFVRNGSFANTNYGVNPSLEVKKSTTGYTRESYIQFDLSSAVTISTARLRLFGSLADTASGSISIGVFATAPAWNEATLTWNTRPAAGAQIGSFAVPGISAKWYEIDLTAYLKAEKAAGRNLVSLALKSLTTATTVCSFASDESAAGAELVIAA